MEETTALQAIRLGMDAPAGERSDKEFSGLRQVIRWDAPYCCICRTTQTDHQTEFCPFLALANAEKTCDLDDAEMIATELMKRRRLNLLRITNNLDHTHELKLHKLFKRYGRVTHAYAPVEGGNGFVNFADSEGAERAMKKLNGSKYGDLILRIEWGNMRPGVKAD